MLTCHNFQAFQVGQWTLADVCYSAGLWQHKKHAQAFLLYLNRSAARLPLEHYQGAYEDAVRASQLMASSASKLATPDQKRKGLLRQAKALYGMEQWTSCHEVLEQCLFTFPNPGLDHQDLFSKVKQRLLEQSQGAYDFPALYKQLLEHKYRLDVASYGGPFEIKPSLIPGAGRGAFATRDIQPGELVMADKAMASAWEGESFKPLSIADISRRRGTRPRQTQLIVEMMFKQNYGHPSVRDRVLDLSTKGLEDLDRSKHAGIDPDRTQSLAIAYAFSLYAPPDAVEANGNGVFFDASFPNSQCVPNCRWVSFVAGTMASSADTVRCRCLSEMSCLSKLSDLSQREKKSI